MSHPVVTPVSLITGFLGSGKTTLLNHVLADAQMAVKLPAPQDWTALLRQSSLHFQIVILLDPLADMELPAWPAQPDTALWSSPDLAARGDSVTSAEALKVLHSLRGRLEILAALPLRGVDRGSLRSDLRDLAYR